MSLSWSDLQAVLGILEKVDAGIAAPEIPGKVGRYLRQYASGRALLRRALAELGLSARADGAVSGTYLGRAELYPLTPQRVAIHSPLLGETADSLCLSEELGGIVQTTLWLTGVSARLVYNHFESGEGVVVEHDYRWSPPGKWTAGEARVEGSSLSLDWTMARSLIAVADDIQRPPHSHEYVIDFSLGAPGIKYFRTLCAMQSGSTWQVLPALTEPRAIALDSVTPMAQAVMERADAVKLLAYREPWNDSWHVVRAQAISEAEALAHALTWGDFQKELGVRYTGSLHYAIAMAHRSAGLVANGDAMPQLGRRLLPIAKFVLRYLRGTK